MLIFVLFLFVGCSARKKVVDTNVSAEKIFSRAVKAYQTVLYDDAEELFKALIQDHPLTDYAVQAQLMLADIYYSKEEYEDAASSYASFVRLHPGHKKAPYALFQKGMSHFNLMLSVDRDQTSTKKALFDFEDLQNSYPESTYMEKSGEMTKFLRERLAEREFYIGSFYFKDKNYKGALARFAVILEDFPDCDLLDKTLFFIARSYEKLGEKELARETYQTLVTRYPNSPYCKGLDDKIKG
ncbi:MAG: outer membrane protein assembly factor BamD [Thermodesulfobacteriota bacterium]